MLVLTAVVVVGKVFGVALGSFLAGRSVRTSVQAGMSLAQIGEFSFIIAGVGVALGATGDFLYPVAVAVSALTTLITPWLIRASGPVASFVDSRLPRALQTFVSLYGSWVQQLRSTPQHRTAWSYIRKLVGLLLVDLVALAGHRHRRLAEHEPPAGHRRRALQHASRSSCAGWWWRRWWRCRSPFVFGAVRIARALGAALVAEALPRGTEALDRAAASRRALLVTFQLAILLLAGIPLAAVTQPFVRLPGGADRGGWACWSWCVPFWRSATNLHGHVRAGAQVILESLASQSLATEPSTAASREEIRRLVPGLGETSTVRILPDGPSVGRTLKDLDLRAQTGATVIAIERGETDLVYPTAEQTLQPGDLLVLTGTEEAVDAGPRDPAGGPTRRGAETATRAAATAATAMATTRERRRQGQGRRPGRPRHASTDTLSRVPARSAVASGHELPHHARRRRGPGSHRDRQPAQACSTRSTRARWRSWRPASPPSTPRWRPAARSAA